MIYRKRPLDRVWLANNWKKWSQTYADKVAKGNTNFMWATFDKELVNHRLLPLLEEMTQNHCAFCDGYPCIAMGGTIEHFKPKSKFPLDSYKWENLFLCCNECQKKQENFHSDLLKPDEVGYDFNTYFLFNAKNGKIEANTLASTTDQQRANTTIKLYRFNEAGRPKARLDSLKNYNKSNDIDTLSYRFLFL